MNGMEPNGRVTERPRTLTNEPAAVTSQWCAALMVVAFTAAFVTVLGVLVSWLIVSLF